MSSRVIFLDYDGVVNTPMWNENGTHCGYNYPGHNKVNNFQAVQWISEFCKKYDYDIVVTSTWRYDDNYKECLINGGLREGIKILGRTPVLSWKISDGYSRGDEIAAYLKDNPEIKHYIIIDDEEDFLPEQQEFFVQTNGDYGFGMHDMFECQKIHIKHVEL